MTALFLTLTASFLTYLTADFIDGAIKLWKQCAPTTTITSIPTTAPTATVDYIVTKFNAWENETGTWVNEFEGWSDEFDAWDSIFDTWVNGLEVEFALEVAKRHIEVSPVLLLCPAVEPVVAPKKTRAPRKPKAEKIENPGYNDMSNFFNSAPTLPTTSVTPMYHKSLTSLYDKFVRKSNGDDTVLNDVDTLLTEFKRLAKHQGYDWKEVMTDLSASNTVEPTLPTVEPTKAKRGRPRKSKVKA